MKKVISKKPNCHFQKGAELLVASYNSPTDFLLFLTDSLDWMHKYELSLAIDGPVKSDHYNLLLIVENVILPWINCSPDDRVNSIAAGIEEYGDFCGYEGHYQTSVKLLAAFSKEIEEFSSVSPDHMTKCMHGINTIIQIGYSLHDYELEINKAKNSTAQKTKLAKVA